jgi:hypothetical protein
LTEPSDDHTRDLGGTATTAQVTEALGIGPGAGERGWRSEGGGFHCFAIITTLNVPLDGLLPGRLGDISSSADFYGRHSSYEKLSGNHFMWPRVMAMED